MRFPRAPIISIAALALIVGGIFPLLSRHSVEQEQQQHQGSIFQMHFQAKIDSVNFDTQPTIAVVPHHLVASDLIYQTLARIARYVDTHHAPVRRIVLLAPNHFERGSGNVLTSRASWKTRDGVVQPDNTLIGQLIAAGFAQDDFHTLELEHGIFNVIPFIETLFPDARVTPLSIRGELSVADRVRLAAFLHQQLGPQDLMIISADFTHYVSESIMKLHDVRSLSALIALNPSAANSMDVDTPASIEIGMNYALMRDAKKFVLTRRTSSVEYLKRNEPPDTTSYVSGVYVAGQRAEYLKEATMVYVPEFAAKSSGIKSLIHGFEKVTSVASDVTTHEAARALVHAGARFVAAPNVNTDVSAEIFEHALIVYAPNVAVGIHLLGSGKQARPTYYIYPLEYTAQRLWRLSPFPKSRELLKSFAASMDITPPQREAIEFERGLSI